MQARNPLPHIVIALILMLLLVLNMVTLGIIPGAFLFSFGDNIAKMILGPKILGSLHGDNIWPISIKMGYSWLTGSLIILASMRALTAQRKWVGKEWLGFGLAILSLDIILAAYLHLSADP